MIQCLVSRPGDQDDQVIYFPDTLFTIQKAEKSLHMWGLLEEYTGISARNIQWYRIIAGADLFME